mgnify:CR=1 FL=1
MNLDECIKYLEEYNDVKLDDSFKDFNCLRALLNITMPYNLNDEFYLSQDKIIQDEYKKKKIVSIDDLNKMTDSIYLYKGDITLLKVDAIVNACNSKLLGCFIPLHNCIDNMIHSYAGLQVRRDLLYMLGEDYHERNGLVKITNGYNLPAKFIFHTVGPIVQGNVSDANVTDLAGCYLSSLKEADKLKLNSIAFPCISTGIFSFPKEKACDIACNTVLNYLKESKSNLKVIFVSYEEYDFHIYNSKLRGLKNDY